jgi:hypothetical protein
MRASRELERRRASERVSERAREKAKKRNFYDFFFDFFPPSRSFLFALLSTMTIFAVAIFLRHAKSIRMLLSHCCCFILFRECEECEKWKTMKNKGQDGYCN